MKTKYILMLLFFFLTISNFANSNEHFSLYNDIKNIDSNTDTTILPEPPSQISIDVAPRKIKISWALSISNNILGYKVYKGDSLNPLALFATLSNSTTSFIDSNLTNMLNTYYVITSFDSNNNESVNSQNLIVVPTSTWYVSTTGSDNGFGSLSSPYKKIQKAINAAIDGETVQVSNGTYFENIIITKNITLTSPFHLTQNEADIQNTIIDGNAIGLPVVRIQGGISVNNAKIQGFTIQNGLVASNGWGAGIDVSIITFASFENLIIRNNSALNGRGAGICTYYGTNLNIKSVTFQNNNSNDMGGAIYVFATTINVTNSKFLNNSAACGAAICFHETNNGNTRISNNLFYMNSGWSIIHGQDMILINNTFVQNTGRINLFGNSLILNSIITSGHIVQNQGYLKVANSLIQEGINSIINPLPIFLSYNNVISGSPFFENPDSLNFNLSDYSPLIGAGTSSISVYENTYYAPTYDINNIVRPNPIGSNPDIGAFENPLSTYLHNSAISVSTEGNDSSSVGLESEPFATIQKAIDYALNGDQIIVKPGTYVNSLNINKSINLRSLNGFENTILKSLGDSSKIIKIIGTGDSLNPLQVNIEGFTFIDDSLISNQIAINLENDLFLTIAKCWFENVKYGISSSSSYYDVINSVFNNVDIVSVHYNGYSNIERFSKFIYSTIINANSITIASFPYYSKFYNTIIAKNGIESTSYFNTTIPFFSKVLIDDNPNTQSGSEFIQISNINDISFTNSLQFDFSLKAFSPAIGYGEHIGTVINDIENNPRPSLNNSLPDVGAYENNLGFPSNAPPKINFVNNIVIDEDSPMFQVSLAGISDGDLFDVQNIILSYFNTNQSLFSNTNLQYVSDSTLGAFNFLPASNMNGNALITILVSDNGGTLNGGIDSTSINFLITINPVNDAPVSNSDQILVNEGSSVTTLSNGMNTLLWNDTDIENNPLQANIVTQPQHGSLVLNLDGTFLYSHDGSESITDFFTYKVSDGFLESNISTVTITINPVNDAPVSNSDQIMLNEGSSVSTLTNGMNTLLWNDTDIENNPLQAMLVSLPQHGSIVLNLDGTFTYTHDGSESINDIFTYKVSDGFLESNISTVAITINPVNDAPISNSDQIIVDEGSSISILSNGMNSLLWNDSDIENNPLQAMLVSQPQHGSIVLNLYGTFTYTHDGSETNTDSFTYKVSDGVLESNISTVTITINPVNDVPVSNSDQILVDEGNSISTLSNGMSSLLWNDTDIENNPLQVMLVIQPQHGSLVLNIDGTFTYTHDGSESINDSFTYKISDGFLESNISIVSITINPVNDAPVSNSDQILVNEGNSISSLSNGMNTLLWNDTDVENNPLQAIIVTQPQHGSLVLNPDGTFLYTHDGSESVNDTFTYKVSDGILESNISTVNITINPVNDAPISNNDQIILNEGSSVSTLTNGMNSLLWNDSDIENDILTVIVFTSPQNGNLNLNSDGTFTYTHDGSETITDSFTYEVSDGFLESNISTVAITINPVNDAPISNSDQIIVDEGSSISILSNGMNNLLWNDTDIENDTLTAIVVTSPQNGSLNINSDGSFTYTHDGSESISDSFTYKVSDGFLESNISSVTITINPVNDNTPFDIYLSSSDINENISNQTIGILSAIDLDFPNDSLTYELVIGNGDDNNQYFEIIDSSLINLVDFDFENQDSLSIRVKVTDQIGHTFEKVFIITVINENDISINTTILNSYCTGNSGNGSIEINSILNTSGVLNFFWTSSNGGVIPTGQQNNQNLTDLPVGTYYLNLNDSYYSYIDTFDVDLISPYDDLSICYVTSDETNITNNKIFINNQDNYNVAFYEILRESSVSGVFLTIGTINSIENSFLDVTSNNISVSYKYKVRLIDSCGNVVINNSIHKTILLQSGVAVNNSVNLSWTHYEGISYPTYNIYRKTNQGTYQLLTQVSSSNTTYNDQTANVLSNNYEYYIAVSIDSCNITTSNKNGMKTETEIKSNRQNIGSGVSLNDQILSTQVTLYPNPSSDIINLKLADNMILERVEIYNTLGQKLFEKDQNYFSIENLSPAIYVVKIYTNVGVVHKTFIKK